MGPAKLKRPAGMAKNSHRVHVGCQELAGDPSPEEIRELCRKIQAGWTPREERRRRIPGNTGAKRLNPPRWRVPIVHGLDSA